MSHTRKDIEMQVAENSMCKHVHLKYCFKMIHIKDSTLNFIRLLIANSFGAMGDELEIYSRVLKYISFFSSHKTVGTVWESIRYDIPPVNDQLTLAYAPPHS